MNKINTLPIVGALNKEYPRHLQMFGVDVKVTKKIDYKLVELKNEPPYHKASTNLQRNPQIQEPFIKSTFNFQQKKPVAMEMLYVNDFLP